MQSKPNGPLQSHRSGQGRSIGTEYAALTAVSRQSLLSTVRGGMGAVRRTPSDNFSVASGANANRCNLTLRELRKQRRRDMKERFGAAATGGAAAGGVGPGSGPGCHRSCATAGSASGSSGCCRNSRVVFDPAGQFIHWWCTVVSLAFLYNLWVILFRVAFMEIEASTMRVWFALDYAMDLIYLLDIAVSFRTGYLEDGVLQTDRLKMRLHYMNSTRFYVDCLCMLPLDFLYLSFGFKSIVRAFRLCKVYKFFQFLDRTERHANYPNLIRSLKLGHYLMLIIHANACVLKLVIDHNPEFLSHVHLHGDSWRSELWYFPSSNSSSVDEQYLFSLYWSSMAVTLMAEMPKPNALGHYVFVICEIVFCLLLFATVLGHVSNIVANTSMARRDFQAHLDAVKVYMNLRRVPQNLQSKVIRWFDYLWNSHKTVDEEKILSLLPDKLKAEMAIHVHLDTLKKVEMFQNTEEGFLSDLVLRLRPVLFSPGDFVCRKGEVGKHMYIISRGKLQVVAEDCKKVLATLRPGSYFGELSILNMGTMGNRRTASVKSVGYSDLFCLSKTDLWDVLKDYPAARVKLEAIAAKRLQAFKKKPIEEANLNRSQSTPGLVESSGKVPIEAMTLAGRPGGCPGGCSINQLLYRTHCSSFELHANQRRGSRNSILPQAAPANPHCGEMLPTTQQPPQPPPPPPPLRPLPPTSLMSPPRLCVEPPSPGVGETAGHGSLQCELNRLHRRLALLEAENSTLNLKLNHQQWLLDRQLHRLSPRTEAEAEAACPLHCGTSATAAAASALVRSSPVAEDEDSSESSSSNFERTPALPPAPPPPMRF